MIFRQGMQAAPNSHSLMQVVPQSPSQRHLLLLLLQSASARHLRWQRRPGASCSRRGQTGLSTYGRCLASPATYNWSSRPSTIHLYIYRLHTRSEIIIDTAVRDSLSCAVLDYHRTKHDPCSKGAQNIGETVLSYVFVFTNIAHCSSLSIFFREKSSGID